MPDRLAPACRGRLITTSADSAYVARIRDAGTGRYRAALEPILAAMLKSYDPTVLGEFAERLIAKANRVVIAWALLGILAALVSWQMVPGPLGLFGVCMSLLVALYVGFELSFRYRVQAHTVLCQVAIEMNTRQLAITIATLGGAAPAHATAPR